MPQLSIGCSGYSYQHWRGNFYPDHLSQKKWFAHYGSIFRTVELNVTFYRIPKAETFQHWYQGSAPEFTFAIKGSRYITHIKRLIDAEESLPRFFTPASELQEKLKVVLWQFPPSFACDLQRLEAFLDLLEAYPVRQVFEFRNENWLRPEVVELCRSRKAALCMADAPAFLDEPPVTGEFVYIRRHGAQGRYFGEYSEEQLARDAERIRSYLAGGNDVYVYYNNDMGGAAPRNAVGLAALLGQQSPPGPQESGPSG
jgi:uncharacterized protein YecE (DUF72 family)